MHVIEEKLKIAKKKEVGRNDRAKGHGIRNIMLLKLYT